MSGLTVFQLWIITVLSIFGGWITGHMNKLGWSVTRARKTGMLVFAVCVVPVSVAGSRRACVFVCA